MAHFRYLKNSLLAKNIHCFKILFSNREWMASGNLFIPFIEYFKNQFRKGLVLQKNLEIHICWFLDSWINFSPLKPRCHLTRKSSIHICEKIGSPLYGIELPWFVVVWEGQGEEYLKLQDLLFCFINFIARVQWDYLLKNGTLRAYGIRKNISILDVGGSTPAPLTQFRIRKELYSLQKGTVQSYFSTTLCMIIDYESR